MRTPSTIRGKRVGGTASASPQEDNAIICEESARSYAKREVADNERRGRWRRSTRKRSLRTCAVSCFSLSVRRFMSITGAESASALQFLEVNLYMESGGQGFGGGAGGSDFPPPAPAMGGSYGDDEVRAPDPSKRQRLVGANFEGNSFVCGMFAIECGGAGPSVGDDSSSRARDLSALFQPPVAIMYQGTYADARMHAKNENKWLLVNIQDEIVFASHMLNRDTWSDDVVQNLVASGFVFWQNYWASEHGKKFCTLYQIDRESLPVIVIIDPRSGEIVQKWTGFLEPQDMTEKLSDFCCTYPMEDAGTSAPEPAARSTNIEDASEDAQLAAAIAASLQNGDDSGMEELKEEYEEDDEEDEDQEEEEEEEVLETLDPEPAVVCIDGTPDVTRVQIRAPDGSRLTRRFLKSDPMSKLWVFVKEQIPEARGRAFELRTAFPPAAVEFSDTASFSDKKLENASLMVKWI
ncbi:putative ubiquitin regulatory protein, partial [Globisporangium splendens]